MVDSENKAQQIIGGGMEEPGNIDKIRDILFGNNIRDYDKRFAQLEERLNAAMEDMRAETRRMFGALESYVKDEVRSLLDQIKTEQGDRAEADRTLERELDKLLKRVAKDEEHATAAHREARQALLDQSKSLHEEIQAAARTLAEALKRESQDLRFIKTDRSVLAAVLNEMAARINGDNGQDK